MGLEGSWQKGRQLPRQGWAMLWGKSWVVLPNVSAILSKISEMAEMPVLKSNLTASFADWSCILRSDSGTLQCLIPSTAPRSYTHGNLSDLRCLPRVPFWHGPQHKWKQHLIWHAYWSMLKARPEIRNKMGNLFSKSINVLFQSPCVPVVLTVPVSQQVCVQLQHLWAFS